MKNITLLILIFYFTNYATAQDEIAFYPDKTQTSITHSKPKNTSELAQNITAKYTTDENKVHAIYLWVITNIKYAIDSSLIINAGTDEDAKISIAFKRRKGVCENFAAIFNDVCNKSGLTSFVVKGYTKQGNNVDKDGHAWCAVNINKNWFLFDPTWDWGQTQALKYYMVPPEIFIDTHMPFDPLWQLLNRPVSHSQFSNGSSKKNKEIEDFNILDSVAAYLTMDSSQRLHSSLARIEKWGIYNKRIDENYKLLRSKREMEYQDEQLEYYNAAMNELNETTEILNDFIGYRNNQFIPVKTDDEINGMLEGLDEKIKSSILKLDSVDKSPASLVLGTGPTREKIEVLLKSIKEQQSFLNKYLFTPEVDRKALFYQ